MQNAMDGRISVAALLAIIGTIADHLSLPVKRGWSGFPVRRAIGYTNLWL